MIRKVELSFFFVLTAGVATVSFFVFKPYLGALFVASVFSVVFRPLFEALYTKIQNAGASSALTLAILFLVILIPATLFGFFIFDDAERLYESAREGAPLLDRFDATLLPFEGYLQEIVPNAKLHLSKYVSAALSFLVDNFGSVFRGAIRLIFQTLIMLLALFYLFRDGAKFRNYIISLSPLANEYDERILQRLETAISSVVKGKLLIVLIQGILASVGFFIFGVPHPVLWGALASLSALIPMVGVALVFVPAVIYLFVSASVGAAIGLLVSGVVIGTIDNILGPLLFEKGLQMHPLLILLSVLGCFVFFGPVGFLAGPVTLSLLFALLDIYPLLFERKI